MVHRRGHVVYQRPRAALPLQPRHLALDALDRVARDDLLDPAVVVERLVDDGDLEDVLVEHVVVPVVRALVPEREPGVDAVLHPLPQRLRARALVEADHHVQPVVLVEPRVDDLAHVFLGRVAVLQPHQDVGQAVAVERRAQVVPAEEEGAGRRLALVRQPDHVPVPRVLQAAAVEVDVVHGRGCLEYETVI